MKGYVQTDTESETEHPAQETSCRLKTPLGVGSFRKERTQHKTVNVDILMVRTPQQDIPSSYKPPLMEA